MRELVGSRPIMQCGASVILVNERGELLLQQRADNGMWGYHGGSVELFENVEEAARRELTEETGLTAGQMTLFGVFSGPELAMCIPTAMRYPMWTWCTCAAIILATRIASRER